MKGIQKLEPSGILCEAITYPPRIDDPLYRYPLYLTAKRYWLPSFEQHWDDPDALTLFFLHATSFHKETWEPTIETLFALVERGKRKSDQTRKIKIREAWCLDCPNHGASGAMNAVTLLQPEWFLNFTCDKYAHAVHYFLTAPPTHGKADFMKRNIVGIGHSLGANAISVVQSLAPKLPFTSLIVVEPMLSPAGPEHLTKLRQLLIAGAYERRDVWPNRETAMVALKRRERTKKWDVRVMKVFIEHGIAPHPGSWYTESPYPGVTLACTRDQEAAMYRDPDGATKPVLGLNKACTEMPVHVVLGGIHDFMPKRTHQALIDPQSPRTFASITIVADSGHLMPQESPDKLADALYQGLVHNEKKKSQLQSKL